MQVLILAAGYGTRLYPLVKDTPKPLLDINGRPLIDYILDRIKELPKVNEVFVVTNNKFYPIFEKWAEGCNNFSAPIRILSDGTKENADRLGSIGDIDFVLKKRKITDGLLVIGGDNLFDFSLTGFVKYAETRNDSVTIGLYDIHDYEKAKLFGVAAVNCQNKVVHFTEKPKIPQSTLIAMCCYYFPEQTLKSVKEYLRKVKKADRAGDYIQWLSESRDVFGFKFSGKWYDIGSIESYQEAKTAFINH